MSAPATFRAWALPAGVDAPGGPAGEHEAGGVRVRYPAADRAWIRGVAEALRAARSSLRRRTAREVAGVLGRVGARFLDPSDPLRTRALELLPPTSGLSPQMAAAVLDGMASDWTGERLGGLLEADLGGPAVLDGFVDAGPRRVRAVGPGLCVQVVSGSVPGVGATALIRSLLVKAPTLLKPGRGDVVLPVLFAEALRREDPTLADAVAVTYWPGGSDALEDEALAAADVVTAYGSDDAVRALAARTPATTRFVAYPHRVSLGVVGRGALGPDRVHQAASEVAGAVAFFDQRGCVSPQVVFVEGGGATPPDAFAAELAGALATLERHLPGGALDAAEASALHQLRGAAELMASSGSGVQVRHGGAASWTVIYDPTPAFAPTCVGRVVRVVPVPDVLGVPALVAPLAAHLQTVGVTGCGEHLPLLAEELAHAGATRVAGFADVPFPPPAWHHDGQGPLRALVRWVDLEGPPERARTLPPPEETSMAPSNTANEKAARRKGK